VLSKKSPASARASGERVIAILGMHRSGTSLLAGTLGECGLDLGEVNASAPGNEKGNQESWLLMALHEDLLRQAGGGWDRPPERPVVWGPLHKAIRDFAINRFAGSPLWGFKDPRTLLVLDGWLEALPALESVGIFRHPAEVAESLRTRTPARFTAEKAFGLWLAYNRRLLDWQRRTGCQLLEYGDDVAGFKTAAVVVARQLGLPHTPDPASLTFYEPRLRHQRADATALPPEVADLYGQLRQLATQPD
jgi:hypothetical protein